ncbi:MAG TPA: VOC family protein [Acidimicrobiia bacterium]|jgi:predicted enzyme related to lactoylglutathione lyase|nr:VOC family protein [Acidimicrobiia bacterium]
MERVTGIGGVFFRAADPSALAGWYEEHLGVKRTPQSYDEEPWVQEGGPTVWEPFAEDTDYFDRSKQWMVNFRVDDLDAMVAQLNEAGIEVEVATQTYPNGRFAHLNDPEENRIELWEPADPGA